MKNIFNDIQEFKDFCLKAIDPSKIVIKKSIDIPVSGIHVDFIQPERYAQCLIAMDSAVDFLSLADWIKSYNDYYQRKYGAVKNG